MRQEAIRKVLNEPQPRSLSGSTTKSLIWTDPSMKSRRRIWSVHRTLETKLRWNQCWRKMTQKYVHLMAIYCNRKNFFKKALFVTNLNTIHFVQAKGRKLGECALWTQCKRPTDYGTVRRLWACGQCFRINKVKSTGKNMFTQKHDVFQTQIAAEQLS